ncbi:mitochondrial translation GTPase Era [Andalucia godoyi]|uniref:Mitochondrial translation GTPase Era n=1 Tax=Andalucia godoyi TaxID=505711 RepID=A0A8K0AHM6_ANDGO|nr:mitochondrial translation GTPase Era [Andalucia godoyi]|eukprot:ANDGO_05643.mRNA.1 mitochondrial translation GTPase Era
MMMIRICARGIHFASRSSASGKSRLFLKEAPIADKPVAVVIPDPKTKTKTKQRKRTQIDIEEPNEQVKTFSFQIPESPPNAKSLTVSITGYPNVGKSTLLNRIIGEKVSIVSPKAQTTRERVRGMWTEDDTQIVFFDTPGVLPASERSALSLQPLVEIAYSSILEAQLGIVVVDASKPLDHMPSNDKLMRELSEKAETTALVLNKIDLVKDHRKLLPIIDQLRKVVENCSEVFMVSAQKNQGIEDLKAFLKRKAQPGTWIYPPGVRSDAPVVKFATEAIREGVFLRLNQEVPYSVSVSIRGWTPFRNGDLRIDADVVVPDLNMKKIVIGDEASVISWVRKHAQAVMTEKFGKSVHLFLHVVSVQS